jgi:hypothetical protein
MLPGPMIRHAGELVQERGVRIVTGPLVLQPVAGLRERRAGRSADDQRRLTDLQVGPLQDLIGGQADDGLLEDGIGIVGEVVGPEAGGRVPIELDGSPDVEAGPRDTEVQAADAGKQADGGEVTHAPRLTSRVTAPPSRGRDDGESGGQGIGMPVEWARYGEPDD